MTLKRTTFLVIGILAFSAMITLFNLGASSGTVSAETFAGAFAIDTKLNPEQITGAYGFDKAHSAIGFRVKHMGLVDVPGYFRDFTGTVNYDGKDVTKSTVEFSAKTTSVDTGVAGRDKHLRTADFFEVEKYPEMTFKSTKIEKKGKNWLVTGDFTMKGVTKQMTIPFQVVGFLPGEKGGMKMGVTAETSIKRRDFGVNYGTNMPNGVATLSNNITVNLQIEANMKKAS
ncbi:MAG: YceI family protein [Pyrinomonadaceae bacterium]